MEKKKSIHHTFESLSNDKKLPFLLVEHKDCCELGVQYVSAYPNKRENNEPDLRLPYIKLYIYITSFCYLKGSYNTA